MSDLTQLVVFRLDQQRYALPIAAVTRIVRAVEVTPLPDAPPIVLGMINVEGDVLPVLDMRRRFRLHEQEMSPSDHFLVAQTARRAVVLAIGEAEGVIERSHAEIIGSTQIVPGLEQFQGVIKLDDDLVLICDLEKFLALEEGRALDQAMSQHESC